ncbi:hypothetical protein HU200_039216 [Digitaria exilis]|uniref:Uncharacterized protein n=1 Tax=Digitaria exilis TaxID=1010633 RepID=A0A835BAG4_9POAL|nr:hypothetical protein HU200_039216 [Digitaria exilis]
MWKVMDLTCNQLSLNGLGRKLCQMSSLKGNVSADVMLPWQCTAVGSWCLC